MADIRERGDAHPGASTVEPEGSHAALDVRIARVGDELLASLSAALSGAGARREGPQALAARLGVDKVLASRVLKAMRSADPMSAVHRAPGPEPLRRVVRALAEKGVDAAIIRRAENAIDAFERLIRDEIGDRSSLDAILSAWAPEARREFELRRKQAAFRAMSQLKGAEMSVLFAAVLLAPNASNPRRLDVVWINGALGLRRLRPGAGVKFATRRLSGQDGDRRPRTLAGVPVEGLDRLILDEFCTSPPPRLDAHKVGEVVHYTLGEEGYGPGSAVDLVFAEVNPAEIDRHRQPGSTRKRYVFAEISTPARALQFDCFMHEDALPIGDPELKIYDTAFEGVADVNDPAREIDRLDLLERIDPLAPGLAAARSPDAPRYAELLRFACASMGWEESKLRGYRCRIDYPIYGSQVAMAFTPPEE